MLHEAWQMKNLNSSNIRIKMLDTNSKLAQHTWKMIKCWMEFSANVSNMKFVLDEWENVGWKVWPSLNFIQHHPTRFFSSFLIFRKIWRLPNASNISSNMQHYSMLDEMLDAFAPAFIAMFIVLKHAASKYKKVVKVINSYECIT